MNDLSLSVQARWLGVLALSAAAFIFNTTEFVPVGLLTGIAASFDMRVAQVGLMLTIYAWLVALASLPLMLATRAVERRRLLAWVFVLFALSHVVCAVAPNFAVLVAGRLGIACAHAVFWSITASLVVRIAPAGRKGQALGMLATGTSLAMVLGIPFGRMIGEQLGWRMTFAMIGAAAVLILLVLLRLLPRLPSLHSGDLRSLPQLLRRPALLSIYGLTIVGVTAHFTAYSYLEPFILGIARQDAHMVTVVLLLFGGAGLLGSMVFGWLGLRHPNAFTMGALGTLTVCLLLLWPVALHPLWLLVLAVVWGAVFVCFALAMQARTLGLASDASDVAMALYSGLFNVGIGAGALLGSRVGDGVGLQYVGLVGALFALLALAASLWALRRYRAGFSAGALQG
ncbi:hypothetical protein AAV94_05660 [Lampropedia cohaerens]|uniref:Major facilitator superfamily (MFS) profile domain-containing protein n=1 Tax=Lampropedia cohaerens TaxID=1610491 RepID=A0A0U1Q0L7_9BURK|nr:sugar transporter [Lampropedia cohaerens]KKW68300.1 hypothetical protein AAV94_05660 [Lampropedia cohaerens]